MLAISFISSKDPGFVCSIYCIQNISVIDTININIFVISELENRQAIVPCKLYLRAVLWIITLFLLKNSHNIVSINIVTVWFYGFCTSVNML